ncbi:MAG: putative PEP-binding protein [Planktomarina sp.]
MTAAAYGGRAKCLQRLIRLDMPVPTTVALSFGAVFDVAQGEQLDMAAVLAPFGDDPLLTVRPSSESPDWGGPSAVLNIGMNDKTFAKLSGQIGPDLAARMYMRFINAYAIHVARLDPEQFEDNHTPTEAQIKDALTVYEDEADEQFPQDVETQVRAVLRSMARAWQGTTARLLRQAKGAPEDAGLGLVVQAMALGMGRSECGLGECGSGVIQFANSETGEPEIKGRYLRNSQGRAALDANKHALYLTKDDRGESLEDAAPEAFRKLLEHGALGRQRLREEMQMEFTVFDGKVSVLDSVRIGRTSKASVRIAVDLAESQVIPKEDALLRVEPKALSELLHRQIASNAERTRLATGIAASPGAATGKLVFSATEAQALAARGEPAVLVRRETGPEDIRGMQAAVAVVTERGGVTSHAAVIGRGMGVPCVVGANDLNIDNKTKKLRGAGRRILSAGDVVTVDGTTGDVLVGDVATVEAGLDDSFGTLLSWADEVRTLGIRANADTPRDVLTALNFKADGIGLCRSEHMFFEADRLTVMREMIFAETSEDRESALGRLLVMQRDDFTEIFRSMEGRPVTIRLLDPPLHEFLPSDRVGLRDVAEALGQSVSRLTARVEQLTEYNPMLGLRGVRLGLTVPEIYDMQARAVFEAALQAGHDVWPEIMIPLVSANREVEIVKTRIDATAAAVRVEAGRDFDYSVGVMVETPRAALKAGEIATHCEFLSFGTNDLTQMTYGLSRDDAGRFMSDYVKQGVYSEDPFFRMDVDGVGELLQIAADRGRAAKDGLTLSICGEHGGDPATMDFVHDLGIDYVSCSPFRVPVARLAAAQSQVRRGLA